MAKSVLLHIGAVKTGSTALQHLMAKHHSCLAAHGISYPVYSHEVGEPYRSVYALAGNAHKLIDLMYGPALNNLASVKASLITDFRKQIHDCAAETNTFIFSCEILSQMNELQFTTVKEILLSLWPGEEVKIYPVLVVRDLINHGSSLWAQLVRRHGETLSLDEFLTKSYVPYQILAADIIERVFGSENLIVIKHMRALMVLTIALQRIGITLDGFSDPIQDLNTNLTLSKECLDVLQQLLPILPENSWQTNFEGAKLQNELYWAIGDFLEAAMADTSHGPKRQLIQASALARQELQKRFGDLVTQFNIRHKPIGGELKVFNTSVVDHVEVMPNNTAEEAVHWISLVKEMANHMLNALPQFEAQRERIALSQRVAQSGIFDREYYLKQITQKRSTGIGSVLIPEMALSHCVQIGWKYGLKPCAFFDPEWYCKVHEIPDDPIDHYIRFGATEGRAPSPEIPAQIAYEYRLAGNIPAILTGERTQKLRNDLSSLRTPRQ